MRVMTVFGTRPEIIRLSQVIQLLDRFSEHVLVHTGQNYDPNLSDIFFHELGLRRPDLHWDVRAPTFAEQAGQIFVHADETLAQLRPDRVVILGDTNSGLAAIIAARMGIPIYHLEAGNRCYDHRVPEEMNRRIIDHVSTILMPYTARSMDNLLREGIERDRIFVIGNPIYEVLGVHRAAIAASSILTHLDLKPQRYFLATLHRAENVDSPTRLADLLAGLERLTARHAVPVIVSMHPHTADKIQQFGLHASASVRCYPPFGFFDFVALERQAYAVISDSGTVQEECAILHVPTVTIRDVTERPETVEAGSSILAGSTPQGIVDAVEIALGTSHQWQAPSEYVVDEVARTVTKIVLGHLGPVGRLRPPCG